MLAHDVQTFIDEEKKLVQQLLQEKVKLTLIKTQLMILDLQETKNKIHRNFLVIEGIDSAFLRGYVQACREIISEIVKLKNSL